MVDEEQQNDEYQFSDMDVLNPEVMNESEDEMRASHAMAGTTRNKNIIRNALIAIGVVIVLMVIYKFFGNLFSEKQQAPVQQTQKAVVPQITQQPPVEVEQTSVVPPTPVAEGAKVLLEKAEQKIAALELSQQNMRADVYALNSQVDSLNNNLNNLMTKITELNQTINSLNAKIEDQSRDIAVLTARTRPKQLAKPKLALPVQQLVFYIRAVIPGRAWLIASNGSTITVREGSNVPGYGIVKLIDAGQGRILTSSGKVIRFSQQDS